MRYQLDGERFFRPQKLSELFDALRTERQRLEGRVEAARSEIKQLVQRHAHQAQFRPFGWEDLCA